MKPSLPTGPLQSRHPWCPALQWSAAMTAGAWSAGATGAAGADGAAGGTMGWGGTFSASGGVALFVGAAYCPWAGIHGTRARTRTTGQRAFALIHASIREKRWGVRPCWPATGFGGAVRAMRRGLPVQLGLPEG